jgi:hypothetical protein
MNPGRFTSLIAFIRTMLSSSQHRLSVFSISSLPGIILTYSSSYPNLEPGMFFPANRAKFGSDAPVIGV